MNENSFTSIEEDTKEQKDLIFQEEETNSSDEITKIPDWSILPPVEINRGNDEL